MAAVPAGFLALMALAAAAMWSKARTERQHRVEHDANVPTTTPLDPSPMAGHVVLEGSVETANWGPVKYRVSTHVNGKNYIAEVMQPDEDHFSPIVLQAGGPRLFDAPLEAENFARVWIISADQQPTDLQQNPAPMRHLKLPSGPQSVAGESSDCTKGFYSPEATLIVPEILRSMIPAAQAWVLGRYVHLTPTAQVAIYQAAREQMLSSARSVTAVVTREVLSKLIPGCDWARDPYSDYSVHEHLVWRSAWTLVGAAAAQVGIEPGGISGKILRRGGGMVVSRGWLGLPDPEAVGLPLERRVEMLVADFDDSRQYPRLLSPVYAERVYARVIGTNQVSGHPIVRIVGEFRNRDVTPKFSDNHGFRVDDDIEIRAWAPTGVRRIFPEGVL